ncbi:MAG: glutathione transferase GstA [Gammaproteobacteria bacterium]|nr:glutathione transferase GstA [Gammaproteobacteria bacterium]
MKLYFSPGACSLAPHIALREAGLAFDLKRVDLGTLTVEHGGKLIAINPKNQIPVLGLDDGQILTEVSAILQYIADLAPANTLAPARGAFERYRLQEWLNFIAAEVHKSFPAFFYPERGFSVPAARTHLAQRFDYVNHVLTSKRYLLGDAFTVADAYLFNVLSWARPANIDLSRWPALNAFMGRILQRPAVRAAMTAEGLLAAAA